MSDKKRLQRLAALLFRHLYPFKEIGKLEEKAKQITKNPEAAFGGRPLTPEDRKLIPQAIKIVKESRVLFP